MARICNREDFKMYILKKLGYPLLDLILETSPIDSCDTSTTATTGTTGISGTTTTTTSSTTGATGACDPCNVLVRSVHSQLDFAIDDALDYFHEHAEGLGTSKAILFVPLKSGVMYYDVPPCIKAVFQDLSRGSSYHFDSEEAGEAVGLFSLQSQFGPRGVFSYLGAGSSDTLLTYEIAYQYNSLVNLRYTIKYITEFSELEHKIFISPTPGISEEGKVLAYPVNMKVDDEKCFNHLWLQRYAVAVTMEQIGRNLSMYNGMQLPGGGEFNSNFYWQNGREDKDKLEDEMASGKYGNLISSQFFTG